MKDKQMEQVATQPNFVIAPCYKNFLLKHEILSFCEFVPVVKLMPMLVSFRKIDINDMKANEMRRLLKGLRSAVVFGKTLRFPENVHANVSSGGVADAMDELYSALYVMSTCHTSNEGAEAKIKYMRSVKCLIDMLTDDNCHVYGIYNRETFEKIHSLQWLNFPCESRARATTRNIPIVMSREDNNNISGRARVE